MQPVATSKTENTFREYLAPLDFVPGFTPVRLAFYKHRGTPSDWIIRWATNSPYSHVELIGPDGLGWSASIREGRVRKVKIDWDSGHWDIVTLPWMDVHVAASRIEPEMGKKYDILGIVLNHVLSLNRSHPEKWFCSELVAYALGLPEPHTYSPGTLADTVRFMSTFIKAQVKNPVDK